MSRDPLRERSAAWMIGFSSVLVAAGGLALGLQVDANRDVSGTGFVQLSIGALLALVATFSRARTGGFPRDGVGVFGVVAAFLGLAFLLSAVLAPGGPWMFFEVFVLLGFVALRRGDAKHGTGALVLLGLLLLFRLWVTYQGSERRWELVSIDVPVLSSLPFAVLDPVKSVSLGSFTPREMNFPPAGLDFALTTSLWAVGFALCAAGLALLDRSLREHEDDRIHALVHTLPAPLAGLVERLLPESEWQALGLHGLAERALAKKIEELVRDRMTKQRELESAWRASSALSFTNAGGVAGGIQQALLDHGASSRSTDAREDETHGERTS